MRTYPVFAPGSLRGAIGWGENEGAYGKKICPCVPAGTGNFKPAESLQFRNVDGANIRLVQELLGHRDVSTTEIYTHVMDKNFRRIESPIERLAGRAGAGKDEPALSVESG